VPTGVALRDVRDQLFDAAERVLRRSGPQALTSRAVTSEAGCAKGVLHRHFADFDEFLVELIRDRAARVTRDSAALVQHAGTATVTENVAAALTSIFQPVALAIVGLLIFRDDLRARVRAERPVGLPVLSEGAAMLGAYLTAEQERGRIRADANIDLLALTLIGTGHVVFAGREGNEPDRSELDRLIMSIVGPALT
jgi:AcrR family transcriptional regulator